MIKITVWHKGSEIEPHYQSTLSKPDRYGKREGYRVAPPGDGHNLSENSLSYRNLEDVADHLRAMPDWGIRMKTADGQANIFYEGILINGRPR